MIETFKDEYTVQRDAYSMGLYGLNSSQTADFPDMARPRIADCFLTAIDTVSAFEYLVSILFYIRTLSLWLKLGTKFISSLTVFMHRYLL